MNSVNAKAMTIGLLLVAAVIAMPIPSQAAGTPAEGVETTGAGKVPLNDRQERPATHWVEDIVHPTAKAVETMQVERGQLHVYSIYAHENGPSGNVSCRSDNRVNSVNPKAEEAMGIPSQAAEGEVGSAEGVETKRVSPNDNPALERPATFVFLKVEDIVQPPTERTGRLPVTSTHTEQGKLSDSSAILCVGIRTTQRRLTGMTALSGNHPMFSAFKAYIAGVIAGDACLERAKAYIKANGEIQYKFRLSLDSSDREFVDRFRESVVSVYGLSKSQVRETQRTFRRGRYADGEEYQAIVYRYQVANREMYDDLVALFGNEPHEWTWRVPQVVFDGLLDVRVAFLSGFTDSEGWVAESNKGVGLASSNLPGLEDVKRLLDSIGIESSLYHNANGSHSIIISLDAAVRFQRLVGFTIPRKAEALAKIVAALEARA